MKPLLLLVLVFFGYIIMYRLYKKIVGPLIFQLDDKNITPAHKFKDGKDFVPTLKGIIFGHHFTSIAGTGPIVGPAIAVIWGWVPAVIWVFVGSAVMGAVHDLGSLVISLRNDGKSISDYTSKYISNKSKLLFFLIVFIELWMVIAIFGLIIAVIFKLFPASVFPVWLEIPIAIGLGYAIYKKGVNVAISSIIALVLMYVTIVLGYYFPIELPSVLGIPPTGVWTIILLIYAFIASVLPVTTLLQPRDFINSHELIVALLLIFAGIVASSFLPEFQFAGDAFNPHPEGSPPLFPFLFITIACGAISGFHALVSSGTSSKQVDKETDAVFVGAGSMMMEGLLATFVIIAAVAGIGLGLNVDGNLLTGTAAFTHHYSSWQAAGGLSSKLGAFIYGSANMISNIGIPKAIAVVIMGVFVASFAGTTLDTATRIQRYIITELFASARIKGKWAKNAYVTTFLAIFTAALLAFASGADGKGALRLWPLFGAINQTLAALALIVITNYLRIKGGLKWLWSGIPAVFMVVMTLWALILNQFKFMDKSSYLLSFVNIVIILIMIWIVVEGTIKFFKVKA